MENDSSPSDPAPITARPSPADARRALLDLEDDGATLAARVVTPWWYHPAVGGIVAVVVCVQALPFPWSLVVLPLAVLGLPGVVVAYRRRYGVWVAEPAGPLSRRLYRAMIATFLLSFAAALVVRYTTVPDVWVLLPAAAAFVAAVVLGPWYDDALRRELAGSGRASR